MTQPRASRPYMPGYGTLGPEEGTGLLPWSWAEERLTSPRNYWVVTLRPDGSPHAMPVWGVWDGEAFWFSSSEPSRKVRNIAADPRCTVMTEDAMDPVVIDGVAEIVAERAALERFLALVNAKYGTAYGMELVDPDTNATIRVRPLCALGLLQSDFTGSPTRWEFE